MKQHQSSSDSQLEERTTKVRKARPLRLYQVWLQDLEWGDEIEDFHLVAARSEQAATRIVLRCYDDDEDDRRWLEKRREDGMWRVSCHGEVPAKPGFVW